jgi:hypothetical protein
MSGGGAAASQAAGAIGGGIFQGYEANKSRQAAGRAYNAGAESLQGSQAQALGYLDPYRQAGQTALSPLTGLLTGNQFNPDTGETTQLSPEQRDALLYQSPGYRFSVDQQNQTLDRSQVARGISLSGGAQKELAQYSSGLASQYSNDYINQLASLAGIGQNAATASANVVQNFGTNIAGAITNQGLTNANYYSQLGNIGGQTFSQLGGAGGGQGGQTGGGGGNGLSSSPSNFSSTSNGQFNSGAFQSAGESQLSPNTSLMYNAPLIAGAA